MTERSKDYHDYVFREGRLVGEFEDMYRNSEGVPWHQDEQAGWIDVRLTVEMLKDVTPFDEIHDLGCGFGYYLDLARERLGARACQAFGYDISMTACAKARELFPCATFSVLDLAASASGAVLAPGPGIRRLFIIRGTLWYVFPKMASVIGTIRALMQPDDMLLVVQNFPPLDQPFIGKGVIPDSAALMRHFSEVFVPLRHLWYQDNLKQLNDNWFIGLFSTRHPS